jgi:peptide subunit release factor RF-3
MRAISERSRSCGRRSRATRWAISRRRFAIRRCKLPEPAITFAIEPKSRADEDKLGVGLHKLMEEDAMLRFFRDPQTKEFLIAGTGQQHIEVVVSKMKKAVPRGSGAEGAEGSVSRDDSREGRRAGTAQETDGRARAVWRLQDQDGAAAARGGISSL